MNLTVGETARALHVTEERVYEWIRTRRLPTCGREGETLVSEAALREWALSTLTPLDPRALPARDGDAPDAALADAVERGGLLADVPGATRTEVVREVVERVPLPEGEDRTFISEMVLAREAIASTGVGNGIAIPHARTPVVVRLKEPIVCVAYPRQPVPFDAHDGVPVHAMFVLLSPNPAAHLSMLGHIAHALHDPALVERLKARAPLSDLLAALRGGARR